MTQRTQGAGMMVETPITAAEVGALRERLYEECWLYLGEDLEDRLSDALHARALARGEASGRQYLLSLSMSGADEECGVLLDAVLEKAVEPTRERGQLAALRSSFAGRLLERAHERGAEKLRVAYLDRRGGPGPYAVAIGLTGPDDSGSEPATVDVVAVVGNDEAEARGRTGLFTAAEVAAVPPDRLDACFEREAGSFRVGPSYRDRVRFEKARHDDPDALTALGAFDAIFASHVLPYLKRAVRHRVLAALTRGLHPGGLLFLGRGESIGQGGGGLKLVLYPGGAVYRRPLWS